MRLFTKYGSRPNEIRRAKREFYSKFALIGFVLLFFSVMILITRLSPRLGEEAQSNIPQDINTGDPLSNPVLIRLREEARAMEQQFIAAREESGLSIDNLDLLEQAIDLQKQVIRYRGAEMAPLQDIEKLESMQSLYDEHMGEFLRAQSDRLELEANQDWDLGRADSALEKLTSAANLQRQINDDYPRSSARNTSRMHLLETRLLTWTTRPFAQEIDQLKEQASILIRTEQFAEALQRVDEAIRLQQQLNNEYRESRYASIFRVRELENLRKDIGLTRDLAAVREAFAKAGDLLEAEDNASALDSLEAAEALLIRVAATYPNERQRYQSLESEIMNFKDTAAGAEAAVKLAQIAAQVDAALRNKELSALRNMISDWQRLANDFLRLYPRSEQAEQINMDRIRYLHELRDHLPSIMDAVHSGLLSVPGHPDVLLFETEVSQALYQRVTGDNPSQNSGAQLPVDSVTWEEARLFCQRLSWLLARPVSLPQRQLLVDAVGIASRDQADDRFWSFENTNRETQPVGSSSANAFGFHDLLGNVAEWMAASGTATPERVVAFGGSVRDSRTRLITMPEEPRSTRERNRFIGFRFVVDTSDPQP
jgi:hypothetical protein